MAENYVQKKYDAYSVILKINIHVPKIMNSTDSLEINVSKSQKGQKSNTSLSDAKVAQKINISGLPLNHSLAQSIMPILI